MPALEEWLHFSENAYRKKIRRPHYTDKELQDNIYQKRREINAAGWTIGANLALIPITAGASALALPVASRSLHIARKKLLMLEDEWRQRGYGTLPSHFFRDGVLPCAVAGTVGAVTMGIDNGFSAAGASAMNHTAIQSVGTSVMSHTAMAGGGHMTGVALQANSLSPGVGHQLWYGVENGVQQGVAVLGHPGSSYITAASPYAAPAYTLGQATGVDTVHQGINYATGKLGDWAQDKIAHRR